MTKIMERNLKELGKDYNIALTIPTYRPRDIAKTVMRYHLNFKKYGHNLPIIVFDDSNYINSKISIKNLKHVSNQFKKGQELYYVGPKEKRKCLTELTKKFGEKNKKIIERIFRPSYGGNRNFILIYTLGKKFISVDDDIFPKAIFDKERKNISPTEGIVSIGNFMYEKDLNGNVEIIDQDIVKGYEFFLGSKVSDHFGKICFGKDIEDPNVDNLGITMGNLESRIMRVIPGEIDHNSKIKVVQSHLTGDADIDSADLVNLFMETGVRKILDGHLPKKFVAKEINEVITNANNRFTGAVLGYDNSEGSIYFLPTNFRCEDFIWRSYLEKTSKIAVAYTKNAQTHKRALSVRSSVAKDWFNELIAQRIKRRVRDSINEVKLNALTFYEPYPVALDSAYKIKDQIKEKRDEALRKIPKNSSVRESYIQFARELNTILKNHVESPEEFRNKLTKIVCEEIDIFNKTSKLWPSILEEMASSNESLPITKI